jgi:hypothetical protein
MTTTNNTWKNYGIGMAKFIAYAIALFVAALIFATIARAQTVSVCWDAPTQRVDGTAITVDELDRYEVEHIGQQVYTVASPNTGFEQDITQYGRHCYRVRVFDTGGLASVWTEEVCRMIVAPPAMIRFRQCE